MQDTMRNIWLCRKTICEMLADRGYVVDEEGSLEEFKEKFPNAATDRSSLKMLVIHKNTNESLLVHFIDEDKLGLKTLKMLLETFERQNIFNIIFVCKDNISPASAKAVEMCAGKFNLEIFKEKEMLFNITKHELVPKHKILNPVEKSELLKVRKLREYDLPKILRTDPVSRYYGAKKGDVFLIERKSETTGVAYYYRLVI